MIRSGYTFVLCFMFAAIVLQAQNSNTNPPLQIGGDGSVQLLYKNEMCFGGLVHSAGFGLNFRRGWHITGFKKRILEIEIVNIRHSKEFKVQNPLFENSKGFYYGKLNSFLVLRPGYGFQKILYEKQDRKGIELKLLTIFGPSIGLAKPVYLEILQSTPDPQIFNVSTAKYDPAIHTLDNIYGRAGYFNGFGESKIYPGGFLKVGLNFEYGTLDDDIKSIEVGCVVDAYPKIVPIMATARNQQVFLGFYINFLYGHKWF